MRLGEHLGKLADFRDLAASAHQAGMKVLLDTVVNHTEMKHPWLDLQPEPGWYNGTRAQHSISDDAFQLIADPHAPPGPWQRKAALSSASEFVALQVFSEKII